MSGEEQLRGWVPAVVGHVFWKKKQAFQYAEDTYEDPVVFAVTDGSFAYEIGEEKGEGAFGDLIFCPPGMAFKRKVIAPLSFHFFTFRWKTESGELVREDAVPSGKRTVRDRSRLASSYYYMEQLLRPGAEDRQRTLRRMGHLLQDLWQLYSIEAELAMRSSRSAAADRKMQEAAHWLRQHAFGPLVVKELGASLGFSPVQFTRRFQAATGQTPMAYVTAIRLQKAQALLIETDWTLDRIAESCGYENGFYLSRMFRRKLGVSPSAFRRWHRI